MICDQHVCHIIIGSLNHSSAVDGTFIEIEANTMPTDSLPPCFTGSSLSTAACLILVSRNYTNANISLNFLETIQHVKGWISYQRSIIMFQSTKGNVGDASNLISVVIT